MADQIKALAKENRSALRVSFLAKLMAITFMCFATETRASDSTFLQWKEQHGSFVNLNEWNKHNPMPYSGYFPKTKASQMKKWYISLGPLGVSTLMHDRSWTGIFKACNELAPIELMD